MTILRTLQACAAALAAALCFATGARAQSTPPFVYPLTVGTSPTQILAANPARRRLIFFNPNATAIIAFCPVTPPTRNNVSLTCAANGAGSITLLPYGSFVLDGGTPSGPPLNMSAAWNAVANGASSAVTVLEFE